MRTTDSCDDKDRVYIRANGDFTYFAADCAYYLDKRRRGFGKIILVLGADHHGYIGRLRAIAGCFGDDPDQTLEILIGQLVNLVRDGQPLRMSKRVALLSRSTTSSAPLAWTPPATRWPGTRSTLP